MSDSTEMTRVATATAAAKYEPNNFNNALQVANVLFKGGLLPRTIKSPEAAVTIAMAGAELGMTFLQSVRSIHLVEGRITLSSDAIVALVKRHPDCEYWVVRETNNERCTIETLRTGDPGPTTRTWTIEDARQANLTSKNNWKAYPAAMLRARCSADLGRAVYPDALMGVYLPEELQRGGARRSSSTPTAGQPTTDTPSDVIDAEFEDAETAPSASSEFLAKVAQGRRVLAKIDGERICAEWCMLASQVLDVCEETRDETEAAPLGRLLRLKAGWTAEQRVDALGGETLAALANHDRLRVAWAHATLAAVADCDGHALRARVGEVSGICTHDELVELASKVVDVQPTDRVERLRHLLAVLESAAKVDAMDASNDDEEVNAVRMATALRQVDELPDVDSHTRSQWKAAIQTVSDASVFAAVEALRIGDALVSAQERVDILRAQITRMRGETAGSTEAA